VDDPNNNYWGETNIESEISNNGMRKVGLHIKSKNDLKPARYTLSGNVANTFTGDVIIENRYSFLNLNKAPGAIAVQGDIKIEKGGINLQSTENINKNSTIFLNGGVIFLAHQKRDVTISQHIKMLTGDGSIFFTHETVSYLFLDELEIVSDLRISNWTRSRGAILVKKTSNNIEDALSKIRFDNYLHRKAILVDFDKDYWALDTHPIPEPTTYGAVFGMLGLGIFIYRKRNA